MSKSKQKYRVILIALFVFSLNPVTGQQDPVYSQYMFQETTINPGAIGSLPLICATAVTRQQWVGMKNGPMTTGFTVDAAVKPFGLSSGVGVTLFNDQAGYGTDMGASLSLAVQLDFAGGTLGIGGNVGVFNKALKPEWFIPNSNNGVHYDPTADPSIPDGDESEMVLDFGAGIFFRKDRLYLGVSSTHLNQTKVPFTTGTYYLSRQYYLMGGYTFQLPNPLWEISPSVFVSSDGRASVASVTSNIIYNKRIWGGVSYRTYNDLIGLVGLELFNGIKIGYSYDFQTSDLRKTSSGSHELLVKYCFNLSIDKSPERYKSIRYL